MDKWGRVLVLVCWLMPNACGQSENGRGADGASGDEDTRFKASDAREGRAGEDDSKLDAVGSDYRPSDGSDSRPSDAPVPDACIPNCFTQEEDCGYDDGCGGICGCPNGLQCVDVEIDLSPYYMCLPTCENACANPQKELGWDVGVGPACGELYLYSPTIVCECGPCDDGNPCTDDQCDEYWDEEGGVCLYLPNDTNSCDDGNPISNDWCQGGVCVSCSPNCNGKDCGDDGCGGSCGDCPQDLCGTAQCVNGVCVKDGKDCNDGNPCTLDFCLDGSCTHTLNPGPCWIDGWTLYHQNPVLVPVKGDPDQGLDNVYAGDVLRVDDEWVMYYGGQGADGHDAIFLARSNNLVDWKKHPSAGNPQPVVDHGSANHVNDPSVVRVSGLFQMFYTEAATGENDRVHRATSADGNIWTKQGMVLDVGPSGSWESDRVGRPSVLYEAGEFRMWYDGQIYGVARHVGYATSPDGINWTKHPANPIVLNEGAVDVDRVGGMYVMLTESGSGTRMYLSQDPVNWQYAGQVLEKSGAAYDAFGQVTPFLLVHEGEAVAIFIGGASSECWCKNRIAVAFPSYVVAGCEGCLVGYPTCSQACQGAGNDGGVCAVPGSLDPSACCACY